MYSGDSYSFLISVHAGYAFPQIGYAPYPSAPYQGYAPYTQAPQGYAPYTPAPHQWLQGIVPNWLLLVYSIILVQIVVT